MVRLLTGNFYSIEAFATNAFEAIPIGPVSDLTLGLNASGGCDWGETTIGQR